MDVPSNIAEQIRGMIAGGQFTPGMRLSQTQLAEFFHASRVPIREALKLLSSEAIVEHDPNRGFFVSPVSLDEARQLARLRDLVEDALFQTIDWPDEAMLEDLEDHAKRVEKLLISGKRKEWWPLHREFYAKLYNLSPKKRIVAETMRLWSLADRYRTLLAIPRLPIYEGNEKKKHEMVEALRSRDMDHLLEIRRERRQKYQKAIEEAMTARGLD